MHKFKEHYQAIGFAILTGMTNYRAVGDDKTGWMLVRGNKPFKVTIAIEQWRK